MSAIIPTTSFLAIQKICAISVCKSCRIGLPSERSAKTHLVEHHSLSIPRARSQAKKASEAANAALSEPHHMRDVYCNAPAIPQSSVSNATSPIPSILPPLEGIESTNGYQCAACPSCFVTEKRIREHFSTTHSDHHAGVEGLWRHSSRNGLIRLQSLFNGNKTKYFPVSSEDPQGEVLTAPVSSRTDISPSSASRRPSSTPQNNHPQRPPPPHSRLCPSFHDTPSLNQHLLSELNRVLSAPTNREKLQLQTPVNPFLARTLLDQHLNEFGVSMEQAAVYSSLLSDRSPVEKLVIEDATRYLLRVPSFVMDISQSVLRDVNLRGYREFTAVTKRSAERYARNFARIIISANRVQHCDFFPATIRAKIAPYFASIQSPSTDQARRLTLLHDLLCSISFQTLDNIDSPRNLFLFQFITFASVFTKFRSRTPSFRFSNASDISPLLASLLYGATSCALTEIHSLGRQAKHLPPPSQSSPNHSELPNTPPHPSSLSNPVSKQQLIECSKKILACFDESKNSAPSTIRRLLTIAHEVNKAEDVKFSFDSCETHDLCGIVKNVHIKMKDLGDIIRSLHQDIRTLVHKLTCGAALPDGFFSDIAALKDSIQDNSLGFSFLVHPQNLPKVRKFTLWLFRQLTSQPQKGDPSFSPSTSTPPSQIITVFGTKLKREAVQLWLENSKLVQEKLLAALHISSGSPGRATELETLCLYNTCSHQRSVYLSQGRAMFVTRYIKQRWLIGADKVIPRFPDPETSKLLLTYLVLFRPLEAYFIGALFGEEKGTTQMASLFSERGIPFSSARIRDVVSSTFHANSLAILFNHFRNYTAGIIPKITENSPVLLRQQLVSEFRAVAHMQSGHSPETAEANYARRSNDIPSVPISALTNYRLFSTVWHKHLGLAPGQGDSSEQFLPQTTSANSLPHPPSLSPSLIHSFSDTVASAVKTEFKKFSTVLSTSKRTRSTASLSPIAKRPFAPRILSPPPRDALKDLKTFLPALRSILQDENASFSSQMQLQVTAAIKEKQHNLLVLMPTGAGKSLTVFLPADMEPNDSTVVFVPLAALVHEHVSTCSRLGISVASWENRHTKAQVYVISIDHTVQELRSFLLSLQEHQKLVRIVIDEAHLLLLWFTFRASIQRLTFALRACDPSVQLVLLTATLPPYHRERLLNLLSIPSILLYASPTSRPNLRFTVIQCSHSPEQTRFVRHRSLMFKALSTLLNEALELLIEHNSSGKILIFTLYRHETEQLGREIDHLIRGQSFNQDVPVRCYHAAMSADELKDVYDFWKSPTPKLKIIVATSAFGTGLDVPDVRYVVHFGGAAGILQYAQEAGRAGRDGKSAQCTIIYNKTYADEHTARIQSTATSPTFSTEEFLEDQICDWHLLRDYMAQKTNCRKKTIYSFIDEHGPGLCLFDNASHNCDVCDDLLADPGEPCTALYTPPQYPPAQQQTLRSELPSIQPISIRTPDRPLLTPIPSQNISVPSPPSNSRQPIFSLPVSRRLSFSNSPNNTRHHPIPPTAAVSTNSLHEFRSACRSLQNLCVPCIVFNNREELCEHRCKHMHDRCRRCFQKGHQVGSCTSFDPKRKNHCYSCSLNQMCGENVHQSGEFGRSCFMSIARDIAWAFWAKEHAARELIAASLLRDVELRRLKQEEQNRSTDNEILTFYNTWLRTSWDGIPNLIRFFLWWYNVARSS